MSLIFIEFVIGYLFCPSRTGFFLFDNKKKQKLPAENFSIQVIA